jgi:16S rRNA (cytosine967-C5)-methyltransferase
LPNIPVEDKIKAGLFVCCAEPNELLEFVQPEWNQQAGLPVEDKLVIIKAELTAVFPWKDDLSEGVDHKLFCRSFFTQPDLFLRLRPGKEVIVKEKLTRAGIAFRQINTNCLALANASKIDEVIVLNEEAVIQDYNSQRIGDWMVSATSHQKSAIKKVWDCCAGSGGKSIMAFDKISNSKLTVSDVRPSILNNLKQRFETAGIKKYHPFVVDLAKPIPSASLTPQHLIIADVPCTGSGTWGRTPEQLVFFDEQQIARYSEMQKKIVGHVIPFLQPGGSLLYITCSVFKKENEEVVAFICDTGKLKLQQMELLKGYEQKADTLFAALFTA